MSGIPFEESPASAKNKRRPFAPSIDRVESDRGYWPDNIRVVCVAVNYALSDWGDWVLKKIAAGICGVHMDAQYINRSVIYKACELKPHRIPGVVQRIYRGKLVYDARISVDRKAIYLGRFQTAHEARAKSALAMQRIDLGFSISDLLPRTMKNSSPRLHAVFTPENPEVNVSY